MLTALGMESGGTTYRFQEQLGYAYDAAGNLNWRTNNNLLQQFNVNGLNELTTITNGGRLTVAGSTTSPATNVTVNTSNAVFYVDRSFASTNQPWVGGNNTYQAIAKDVYGRKDTNSITVNLLGTNTYTYDLNGNLVSDGKRGFDYDDENQLIRVTITNAWKTEFSYDGLLRRRITKDFTWTGAFWTETNEVRYLYDGKLVVQERDTNNLPLVTYTRGKDLSGSLQGAGGIGGLLARTENQSTISPQLSTFGTAYYHADGNGNVTCLIYPNQYIAAKYLYDPYGNLLAQYGMLADANSYRFSSKEWNVNSGLYYYGYRFYEPNLQRWLNQDPIQERGGINLYGFIGNNPINALDLWGFALYFYRATPYPGQEGTYGPYLYRVPNVGGPGDTFEPDPRMYPILASQGGWINDGGLQDESKDVYDAVNDAVNAVSMVDGIGEAKWLAKRICKMAINNNQPRKFKKPRSGQSGKEKADDVPDWARGNRPYTDENGKTFAERLMDQKYGAGGWSDRGPASEFNKIKKWGDRAFE